MNQKLIRYKEDLAKSVSTTNYDSLMTDLTVITSKYRAVLNNNALEEGRKFGFKQLELELKEEKEEKLKIENMLSESRQKIISLETSLSIIGSSNQSIHPKVNNIE